MRFLAALQALDQATKTKILVVATIIIMVIVIYFWLAYFNNILTSTGQAGRTTAAAPAESSRDGGAPIGPWQAIKNQFMGVMRGLNNILQAPRQYIISPPK